MGLGSWKVAEGNGNAAFLYTDSVFSDSNTMVVSERVRVPSALKRWQ